MYRYLQTRTGWFDSPAWKVEGGDFVPKLVTAFEQLADYAAKLKDDDARLVALADALNDAGWEPERLDDYLYHHIVGIYVRGDNASEALEEVLDDFVLAAAQIARTRQAPRFLTAQPRTPRHCASQKRRAVWRADRTILAKLVTALA
jgi:hypothetical protein